MKLVYYEFKKLLGQRYLAALLLIMTALCSGLYYYLYEGNTVDKGYASAAESFFREYNESPEKIEEIFAAYRSFNEEIEAAEAELIAKYSGVISNDELNRLLREERENHVYTDRLGYAVSDEALFGELERQKAASAAYKDGIQKIIATAKRSMRLYELSGATDAPAYKYEEHFAEVYSHLLDEVGELEPTFTRGWDRFLHYDEVMIFVFVFLTLASGIVFLSERTSGFLPVLRTAKRGRLGTTAAKIVSSAVMAVLSVVIFTAGVYLTCGVVSGFSSSDLPIQTVLPTCPYVMTVGEYSLLVLLMRCLAVVTFSCAVTLAASLTFSPLWTYISGAVLLTANMIANFFVTSSDWILVGLFGMSSAHRITSAYSEVIFFGRYYSTLAAGAVIYCVIILILSAVTLVIGGRCSTVPARQARGGVSARIRARLTSMAVVKTKTASAGRKYPLSLYGWECSKLLCTPAVMAAVAVLFAMSCRDAYLKYSADVSGAQLEYGTYVNERLFGPLTDGKIEYIADRTTYAKSFEGIGVQEEMVRKYASGEITEGDYFDFLDERSAALTELMTLEDVETQARYLEGLSAETGIVGWFFQDVGIMRILERDINIFLTAAMLIVFSRVNAADYAGKSSEGNFISILQTTRRGRRETYRARLLAALTAATAIWILFTAVELAVGISFTERLPEILSAPMVSVEKYRGLNGTITVGGYLAAVLAIRYIGYMLLALLTVSASYLLKKIPPTLLVTAIFTLLPYLLVYMGVLSLRYVDFTAMLAGGKLLLRSAGFAAGSAYPFAFAVMLVMGYGSLTAAALGVIRQRIGK